MTTTTKAATIDRFYVRMECLKDGSWHVGLYADGRTRLENYYSSKEKARACFNRYCNKARKEA